MSKYYFGHFLLTNLFSFVITNMSYSYKGQKNKKETAMNTTDRESLDYFYEELESYYDEDEQGEIFDGLDD